MRSRRGGTDMKENLLKKRLAGGEAVLGLMESNITPNLVELYGLLGFDFIIFDTEHGNNAKEDCENLIRAAECAGYTPLIRVEDNARVPILRALDLGAGGIIVPMVETPEDGRQCVDRAKYFPLGSRGLSTSTRAASYGVRGETSDYVRQANAEILVAVQIETQTAVDHLEGLLALEGVDIYYIGPSDLSQSMGYPGQKRYPQVQDVIAETVGRITRAGRVAGIQCGGMDDVRRYYEMGARFLSCSSHSIAKPAYLDFLRNFRALSQRG